MGFCDWVVNQADLDGDGVVDFCDICPNDPNNDIDGDGLCGDVDDCPNDPNNECDRYNIQLINLGTNTEYDSIFESAKLRWESIIIGDVYDINEDINWFGGEGVYNGFVDDIVIGYNVDSIDGEGSILGFAGPLYIRSDTFHTISGIMVFDEADLGQMVAEGVLEDVILHEMGHVLGIGTLWSLFGLGNCPSSDVYRGVVAQRHFNEIGFGGDLLIETDGNQGTACGHWDEVQLDRELMTGYVETGVDMYLSKITTGSLEDMGYLVDHSQADDYSPSIQVARRSNEKKYHANVLDLCKDKGICPKVVKLG